MTVSLNWLKEYIDIPLTPTQLSELLTNLGLEVEGMHTVETIAGGLKGFVTGEVLTCERFEVKGKQLSLCTVRTAPDAAPAQIVCGAANVAAGQKVIVATVGTTLYGKDGAPLFTIDKKKTYGHFSEGMICAEDELGIGDSHEGIMVLPADTPVGIPAATYFNLRSDIVYEIGLTPNRSDATNHVGVAQDIAAALQIAHQLPVKVRMPDVSGFATAPHAEALPIQVTVADAQLCPRYCGVCITNVKVGASPHWLQERLQSIGIRSINNVVDVTNFILHELGQPLHAFDYDAIAQQHIKVQTLPAGTPFISLDEVTRTLHAEDLMICDGNHQPLCIGGVFGGISSGVTNTTTRIFLESAHFNSSSIRRSSTHHNLRTEAAKIFEKGSDPAICRYALERAALLLMEVAGGQLASEVIDLYPAPIAPRQVRVRYAAINRLIGHSFDTATIRAILQALRMQVIDATDKEFVVAVPTNKTDVTREVDVIEEILRIYGYNNIPMPTQLRTNLSVAARPDALRIKNEISALLTARGYHEMMAMSITQSKYFTQQFPQPAESLVYINNTSNGQLDVMRPTMVFSGLEAILHNQNRQQTSLRLFEFGKAYTRNGNSFTEKEQLTVFLTGNQQDESWLTPTQAVDFHTLKATVEIILQKLGIKATLAAASPDACFAMGATFSVPQGTLVQFGQLHPALVKSMDIKNAVYYAEFDWQLLLGTQADKTLRVTPLHKYPSVRRDLALIVNEKVTFAALRQIAEQVIGERLAAVNLFDVYTHEQHVGAGKKSYALSFLFEDATQTLKEETIDGWLQQLIAAYTQQVGAALRQ